MNLNLGPIGQISRSVQDITQSETWYKTVLGVPHLFTFGKLAFFDCGGVRLFLSQEEAPHVESILYLRVPDIQQSFAELQSRGGRVCRPAAPDSQACGRDGGIYDLLQGSGGAAAGVDVTGRAGSVMASKQPEVGALLLLPRRRA